MWFLYTSKCTASPFSLVQFENAYGNNKNLLCKPKETKLPYTLNIRLLTGEAGVTQLLLNCKGLKSITSMLLVIYDKEV
jgi:hypothetical protein